MISKKLEEAINAQINAELWSAYLYLSMSAYLHRKGFTGMANWFMVQFKEEQDHAMIFYNYLQSRGGDVRLAAIDKVETEWANPLIVFENTLAHEKKVTGLINNLMDIAVQEKDYAAQSRLQWFIDEQVEEEENASDIIQKLKLLNGNTYGMYVLDRELAARIYKPAALLEVGK